MEVATPPTLITTARLELRRYEVANAQVIFDLIEENRDRLGEFLPWVEKTKSLADEVKYLEFARKSWESNELFEYAIFHQNKYIGSLGVHTVSWSNESCEIGYWIGQKHSGQGFMKEAVLGVVREAFKLGFFRIEIRCDQKNRRSSNLAVQTGFRLEALLSGDKIVNGRRRNSMIFALTRIERDFDSENLTH